MKPVASLDTSSPARAPARTGGAGIQRGRFEWLLEQRRDSARAGVAEPDPDPRSAAFCQAELCHSMVPGSATEGGDDQQGRAGRDAMVAPITDEMVGEPATAKGCVPADSGPVHRMRVRPLLLAVRTLALRSDAAAVSNVRYRLHFASGSLAGLTVTLTRLGGVLPVLRVEINADVMSRLGIDPGVLRRHLQDAAGSAWLIELRVAREAGVD